ncbi:MAG: trypsin-like peptidase domain-containing protein [Dehalococcoidia bacterium]|nr:trypsin-like peptidase domain-containing protein [Dehalococcoidia bacterium]
MTLRTRPKLTIVVPALSVLALVLAGCVTIDKEGQQTEVADTPTASTVAGEGSDPEVTATPRVIDSGGGGILTTPQLVEFLKPSIVQIAVSLDRGQSVGTGVILDDSGHILTNWHVVEGAKTITVAFEDGDLTEAELFRRDPLLDLAIVRVDRDDLKPAIFGDSDYLRVGEDVVAIGHALGLEGGPTVSKGVVSALDRTILDDAGGNLSGLVQTDAAINSGNSGGPLVNMFGEVVGINTAKIQSGDRLGFSININAAKTAAYNLIAQGPMPPPGFLGVGGVDVTRALARALGLPVRQGFGITLIEPGSPAVDAGLRLDDIIVQLDDVEIIHGQDLTDFLREHPSGSDITVKVVRDARFLVTLEVTLVERPGR